MKSGTGPKPTRCNWDGAPGAGEEGPHVARRSPKKSDASGSCRGRAWTWAFGADSLVDDFESGQAPWSWTFSNGSAFPGATGSLS